MKPRRFDQTQYWLKRHRTLRGQVTSVGKVGSRLDDAERASRVFQKDLGEIACALYPSSRGNRTVLDVGCGIGRAAPVFHTLGFRYMGIDLSPEAIEDARRSCPEATFESCNLLDYEPKESFDLILVAWVLVHFVDDSDWAAMLDLIVKCSRPGSLLCLIDVMSETRFASSPHYLSRPLAEYEHALALREFASRRDFATKLQQRLHPTPAIQNLYVFEKS